MTETPTPDLPRRKAQLLARLHELDRRLHGIESELLSHQSRDWEDLATEREGDEVLNALGDDGRLEVRMIQAALARVRAGDYGYCTTCGTRISDDRLDLLPATPFCRTCAP
jgi:RNA polymerase-binding transcription factor DksA